MMEKAEHSRDGLVEFGIENDPKKISSFKTGPKLVSVSFYYIDWNSLR